MLVAGLATASAQSLTPRLEVGANFSNLSAEHSNADMKIKAGLRLGGAVEIALSDLGIGSQMYLAPGLTYKMAGTIFKGSSLFEDIELVGQDLTFTTHELMLPVNLGFRFRLDPRMAVSVEVGPYLAYSLSGKLKVGSLSDTAYGEHGFFKRFNAGANIAAAFEYDRYFFRLGAEYGLTSISKANEYNKIRNVAFFTMVGIRF